MARWWMMGSAGEGFIKFRIYRRLENTYFTVNEWRAETGPFIWRRTSIETNAPRNPMPDLKEGGQRASRLLPDPCEPAPVDLKAKAGSGLRFQREAALEEGNF